LEEKRGQWERAALLFVLEPDADSLDFPGTVWRGCFEVTYLVKVRWYITPLYMIRVPERALFQQWKIRWQLLADSGNVPFEATVNEKGLQVINSELCDLKICLTFVVNCRGVKTQSEIWCDLGFLWKIASRCVRGQGEEVQVKFRSSLLISFLSFRSFPGVEQKYRDLTREMSRLKTW